MLLLVKCLKHTNLWICFMSTHVILYYIKQETINWRIQHQCKYCSFWSVSSNVSQAYSSLTSGKNIVFLNLYELLCIKTWWLSRGIRRSKYTLDCIFSTDIQLDLVMVLINTTFIIWTQATHGSVHLIKDNIIYYYSPEFKI